MAVLDTIEAEGLLAHVAEVGAYLAAGISGCVATSPLLTGVRGRGLWLALELDAAGAAGGDTPTVAAAVETAARDAGFLVNAVAPDAVRLAPPLVLTAAEADTFLAALPDVLSRAASVLADVAKSGGAQ